MSKRNHTLLNEATVRRFMKYANLESNLVENFMDRVVEEDDAEEMEPEMADEVPAAEGEMEMDLAPEAGDEMDAPADPAIDEEVVEDLVTSIVAAISDVTGVEVDVEGGSSSAEMPADLEGGDNLVTAEPEVGAEPELPAEEEDTPFPPVGNRDEDEELQEVDVIDDNDEELTEAVLRRVVERLLNKRK